MLKASALFPVTKTNRNVENAGFDILTGGEENLIIEFPDKDNRVSEAVENLAVRMYEMDAKLRDILQEFKRLYSDNKEEFLISLKGWTDEEKEDLKNLFSDLSPFMKEYYFCSECNTLSGQLTSAHGARKLITGEYMEIAVYKIIKDILKKLSSQYGKTFRVYRNVKVSNREKRIKNEFDLVIENVDDSIIYIVEVKSGIYHNDCEKCIEVEKRYHVEAERFLMITNYMTEYTCKFIERNCGYYVANLKNLEEKVLQMLSNDIKS